MLTPSGYRKKIHHYDIRGHIHELTFSCYQRRPLLMLDGVADLLVDSLEAAIAGHQYSLLAYVFMPEHVHLLVLPGEDASPIARLLFAIKKPHSFRVKRMLGEREPQVVKQLTIRERPSRTSFRFWQEGGGYDRNLVKSKTVRAAIDYIHANPMRRGLCDTPDGWQWSSWSVYANYAEAATHRPPVSVFVDG